MRDFDAGSGVEIDVCDEVVGVRLLPVTRLAICA